MSGEATTAIRLITLSRKEGREMAGAGSFVLQIAVRHGPWAAAIAALAVTPVGYAVIAAALERRVLRPSSEFVALSCGDPLLAVSVALGVWLLHGRAPDGVAGPPFALASLAGWLGFGLLQWRGEVRSGFYTRDQALAPTKIWHQLVVYPALGYWTWTACVGGMLAPADGRAAAAQIAAKSAAALCVVAWLLANAYDRRHPKLGHPPYSWRRLRPQPKPWAPRSASLRFHLGAA